MDIQAGQLAPNFLLPDQDSQNHRLSDYLGKWVLLFFYPEDDTPGCITEACALRDSMPLFSGSGAVVLGVSGDSVASHKKFADKYGLSFSLLADETKQVLKLYGIGSLMGARRLSFLINPAGIIAKVYEKVKPEIHAGQVLEDLKAYAQAS